MLRDTGCSKTLVNAALVPPKAYLEGNEVKIMWGDGRSSKVPLSTVCFDCEYIKGEYEVGELDSLPEDVLFGNDLAAAEKGSQGHVFTVETRGQILEREQRGKEADLCTDFSSAVPKAVDTVPNSARITELVDPDP